MVVEGVRLKLRVVRGGLDSWLRLLFGLSCSIGEITTPVEETHKTHTHTHTQKRKETRTKQREREKVREHCWLRRVLRIVSDRVRKKERNQLKRFNETMRIVDMVTLN